MIYWLIGQPCCGKTTLAKMLKTEFELDGQSVIHLDGDDLRKIFSAKDGYTPDKFSREWRNEQTRILQRLVSYLSEQVEQVIVSTVNPYRDVREEFKKTPHNIVVEIYVHKTDVRERESFNVADFEPPLDDFISINTTGKKPEESLWELWKQI